jgi:hypothetical protein
MMSAATLAFIQMALQVLQMLIVEVPQAVTLVRSLQAQLNVFQAEHRDPTADEWTKLNQQITEALTLLGNQAKLV